MTQRATHERYLVELTSLPTAAGREGRVVEWVQRWAKRRRSVELQRDRFGNLMLKRREIKSARPIVLAAHMDHPAFVVTGQLDGRTVEAEFRGGVMDGYFVGSKVALHGGGAVARGGRVVELHGPEGQRLDKRVVVRFGKAVEAEAGNVMTWDLPAAKVVRGRLRAPACDDLAGVAAAVSAFEMIGQSRQRLGGASGRASGGDVRVLLTRAEEVGFVGAMAACRSGILPKGARIVAIENSKSYAESPIGGGPIVRVGDRTSTFDPDLTYRVGKVAEGIAAADEGFRWQRRLMPGGTCEASAYQALGYRATCVCLPLGNYHNMNEQTGRIDAETIALSDYHGLVRLLVEVGRRLDGVGEEAGLKARLDEIFAQRRGVLE